MAIAVYVAWMVSGIFMLLFAAVLIVILLRGVADLFADHTFVPQRWAFVLATVGLSIIIVAFVALFGTQVASQVAEVFRLAPAIWRPMPRSPLSSSGRFPGSHSG